MLKPFAPFGIGPAVTDESLVSVFSHCNPAGVRAQQSNAFSPKRRPESSLGDNRVLARLSQSTAAPYVIPIRHFMFWLRLHARCDLQETSGRKRAASSRNNTSLCGVKPQALRVAPRGLCGDFSSKGRTANRARGLPACPVHLRQYSTSDICLPTCDGRLVANVINLRFKRRTALEMPFGRITGIAHAQPGKSIGLENYE